MLPNPKLDQIMDRNPQTVSLDQKLSEVLRLFDEFHLRHVPVCRKNRPVGLLSDRDLKQFSLSILFQDRPNVNEVFLDHVIGLRDIYREDFCALSPEATLLDALEAMESMRFFCVPVVDDKYELLGVVGVSNVLSYLADVPGSRDRFGRRQKTTIARKKLTVSDIMTREPTAIDINAGLSEAIELMSRGGFRHLPVLRNDEPVGMISSRDLLRFTYSAAFDPESPEELSLLDEMVDIDSVMASEPPLVSPSAPLSTAAQILVDERTGALLVTSKGGSQLDGIVTERDFIRLLRKELHEYWQIKPTRLGFAQE